MAGSGACDVLQACKKRSATKYSSLFNHAHLLLGGHYSHDAQGRKEFLEEHERMHKLRIKMWQDRTGLDPEVIEKTILDRDRTLGAKEALAEKWIDEVIE